MMALSGDLKTQFAKVVSSRRMSRESTVVGTIVEYNGAKYVQLDGSDQYTPIYTTSEYEVGDRVTVMIKNHTATLTGNMTSPAPRSATVTDMEAEIARINNLTADMATNTDLNAAEMRAAKTATNYMKFDNGGLCIGDQTAETLGKNVLIDADSVVIRNGDDVLASFAESLIELGKANPEAVINLCNGVGKIWASCTEGTTFFDRLWLMSKNLLLRGQTVDITSSTQTGKTDETYSESAYSYVSANTNIGENTGIRSAYAVMGATQPGTSKMSKITTHADSDSEGESDPYASIIVMTSTKTANYMFTPDGFRTNKPILINGRAINDGYELPTGTDLNNIKDCGIYFRGDTTSTITNVPSEVGNSTWLMEVFPGGGSGQRIQRITRCQEANPLVVQRVFYTDTWGDWVVTFCKDKEQITSYTSGWAAYNDSGIPTVRRSGNVVTLSGAMKNTSEVTLNDTDTKIFSLPSGYAPAQTVYALCNGSGANKWLISVKSDGNVCFARYGVSSFASISSGAWFPFTLTWVVE